MARRGKDSLGNLTAVSNNAGAGDGGLASLTKSGQITKMIQSYLGNNKALEQKYYNGEIAIELCPQGTLAERIRAGGAGIPAFYTPTGVNTHIETGEIPVRLGPGKNGSKELEVLEYSTKRETRVFNGKKYNMEHAIEGDVGILRAWRVDEAGNCRFRLVTIIEENNSSSLLTLSPATPLRLSVSLSPRPQRSALSRPRRLSQLAPFTPTMSTFQVSTSTVSFQPLPTRLLSSRRFASPRDSPTLLLTSRLPLSGERELPSVPLRSSSTACTSTSVSVCPLSLLPSSTQRPRSGSSPRTVFSVWVPTPPRTRSMPI